MEVSETAALLEKQNKNAGYYIARSPIKSCAVYLCTFGPDFFLAS